MRGCLKHHRHHCERQRSNTKPGLIRRSAPRNDAGALLQQEIE
jgi:hypothetical protein